MDKKIKVLLLLLGIVSLSAAGIAAWTYLAAQGQLGQYAEREGELKQQLGLLERKLTEAQEQMLKWQDESELAAGALDKLTQEHTRIQEQYNALLKARDDLAKANAQANAEIARLKKVYAQEKTRKMAEPEVEPTDKFLAGLLAERANLEVQAQRLEKEIKEIKEKTQPTQERISELEKETELLQEELGDAGKVSDILSNDLLNERKRRDSLEKDLAKSEQRLREVVQEKDRLAGQLNRMKAGLEDRLAELNKTQQVLEAAVAGVEEVTQPSPSFIQLPPIVVKAGQQEQPVGPLEMSSARPPKPELEQLPELAGRIIQVSDKHKFVIIDLGKEHGVEKEMSFDILRKGRRIGRLEVIEVRQNIAACDVKEKSVRRLTTSDTVHR